MPTQPGILYIHHQAGSNFAYPGSEVVAEIDWIKFCPAGCNCKYKKKTLTVLRPVHDSGGGMCVCVCVVQSMSVDL